MMDRLTDCCGRHYIFGPRVLHCNVKPLCTIPREAKFYTFQRRFNCCHTCFIGYPGKEIVIGGDASCSSTTIKKSQFQEVRNDLYELEPLVLCVNCGRTQHQICALHLEQMLAAGFVCDRCLKKKGLAKNESKFTAKRLQTTQLSDHLETRVNKFLKKEEAGAREVVIRVVSCKDKTVKVKPRMSTRFVKSGQLLGELPYRAKALFAFQMIDGVDVCFFGMHVQEYGSDSPTPNNRRVYLAHLDSVHFFEPRKFKTAVYHEILLGYLEYVRHLGYTMVHIRALSPSDGEDYIFHSHPTEQKTPNSKRLQDWCKKMLDKGVTERIVLDYKDIHKQALADRIKSPAELPYFEGDLWPLILEESIGELEEEEKINLERYSIATEVEISAGDNEEEEISVDDKEKCENNCNTYVKNKMMIENSTQSGSDLTQKLHLALKKHKKGFFVIRLHSAQSAVSVPAIQDPDPIIACDLMDGRNAFLTFAREKHLEFSSLRKAKFSTLTMLYELHNQRQDKFVYTCNNCKLCIETRYHCQECKDFDLCTNCFTNGGHQHRMIKLDQGIYDDLGCADSKNLTPQEARMKSIQRCIQSVVHSAQCRDAHCSLPSCQQMKRVLAHTKVCKKKRNNSCSICKQLIALCCLHAKICKDQRCVVPYCWNIKQKVCQLEMQERLQQQQLVKRRLLKMISGMFGAAVAAVTAPFVSKPVEQAGAPAYNRQQPLQPSGIEAGTGLPPVEQAGAPAYSQQQPLQPSGIEAGTGLPPVEQAGAPAYNQQPPLQPSGIEAGTSLPPVEQAGAPAYNQQPPLQPSGIEAGTGLPHVEQAGAPAYNQHQPLQPSGIEAGTGLPLGGQAPPPNILEVVRECDGLPMNPMAGREGEPNAKVRQPMMQNPQQKAQQRQPNGSIPGMEQVRNRYPCSGGMISTTVQGAPSETRAVGEPGVLAITQSPMDGEGGSGGGTRQKRKLHPDTDPPLKRLNVVLHTLPNSFLKR